MTRRRHRDGFDAEAERILLGDDYKFTRDPEEAERRRQRRKERAEAARKRSQERMRREWQECVVPGCRYQTTKELCDGIEFPVCTAHAVAAWFEVQRKRDNPYVEQMIEALAARKKVIREEWEREEAQAEAEYRKALAAGTVAGDIYFLRANGLVKVGWSADVHARLRAYGPNIEVLCVYAGTRQDETALHRQLKPSRAKGREWYHDDDIMRAFVAEAVAKYGKPGIKVEWSAPAEVVAGKRATRRR